MNRCVNCGEPLAPGAQFCSKCGTPVAAPPQVVTTPPAAPPSRPPIAATTSTTSTAAPPKRSTWWIVPAVIVGLVLLAWLLLVGLPFGGDKKEVVATATTETIAEGTVQTPP